MQPFMLVGTLVCKAREKQFSPSVIYTWQWWLVYHHYVNSWIFFFIDSCPYLKPEFKSISGIHHNLVNGLTWISYEICKAYCCFQTSLLLYHFDVDICTAVQASLATKGWPSSKQHLTNKSTTLLLCPLRHTVEFYSFGEQCCLVRAVRHGSQLQVVRPKLRPH